MHNNTQRKQWRAFSISYCFLSAYVCLSCNVDRFCSTKGCTLRRKMAYLLQGSDNSVSQSLDCSGFCSLLYITLQLWLVWPSDGCQNWEGSVHFVRVPFTAFDNRNSKNAHQTEPYCMVEIKFNVPVGVHLISLSSFFMLSIQATRSSERSSTRPRSPPLPAHLKNAQSSPPSRSASQRPTRTPAALQTKFETSRTRAAAKPQPPAAKSVPKTNAKTPQPSRSSRVCYKF